LQFIFLATDVAIRDLTPLAGRVLSL